MCLALPVDGLLLCVCNIPSCSPLLLVVLLQLPGDTMLAAAGALAASLSFHLDGCVKRTTDGVDCAAALQSAALATDSSEAGSLTVQLSVSEEDGNSIVLGTEHWLPVQPAVIRMLRSASVGSSSAADAAANLQALILLAQLPIRGAPCDNSFVLQQV